MQTAKNAVNAAVGKVIKERMTALGLRVADIASALGVNPVTVAKWRGGTIRPSAARAEKLAVLLQCSVGELLPSVNLLTNMPAPDSRQRIIIRAWKELGEAETMIRSIDCSRRWVAAKCPEAAPENLRLFTVSGDAMTPTLKPLDAVLVDVSATALTAEGLYLVNYGGADMVKRLAHDGEGVRVISDNPAYGSNVQTSETLTIIGRVALIL